MRIATVIAAAALVFATGTAWLTPPAPTAKPVAPMADCVYEDGSGGPLPCLWDAEHRGNGIGDSFIVNRDGSTTYLD